MRRRLPLRNRTLRSGKSKLRVILSIGALAISTAINYLIIYMPTYAVKTLNLPPTVGFAATFAAGIALTFLTPIAGMISDKVGRTTHMIAVNLLLLFSIYPAFLLLTRNPTPQPRKARGRAVIRLKAACATISLRAPCVAGRL